MPRLDQILSMLAKSPNDAFLLYAAALEYKKASQFEQAIDHLNRCLAVDPNYCYAYYQKGQVLEESGDNTAAAKAYREGIVAARRVGDGKAEGELLQALAIVE
ncbi:MAG: tetratricopeptide repeat protein [Tepidisphaeraceae bacterium]